MQRKYSQLCGALWRTTINKVIKLAPHVKAVSFVALCSLHAFIELRGAPWGCGPLKDLVARAKRLVCKGVPYKEVSFRAAKSISIGV